MRPFLLLLLLLFPVLRGEVPLPAGRVRYRAYTEEMGLRSQNISALAQDRDGILHVGTASGLYRFGGSRFTLVPLRKDVAAPTILVLLPHPEGGVWVGTMSGLAWVRGSRVEWATFDKGPANMSIYSMGMDGAGHLWVAGSRGLFQQAGALQFKLDPVSASWAAAGITIARALPGSGIAVLDGKHVFHRLLSDGRWEHLDSGVPLPADLVLDRDGRVWHLLGDEVRILEPGATTFRLEKGLLGARLAEHSVAYPDPNGGIQLATEKGIVHLLPDRSMRIAMHQGLPEEGIYLVHPDAQGNLWFGGVGLFRLLGSGWFQAFATQDGLPGNVVWAVHRGQKSGRLWVGTQNGLGTLEAGRFRVVPGTEGLTVNQVYEDPAGGVWFPTASVGLQRIPPGQVRPQRVKAFDTEFPGRMTLAPDGSLWVNGGSKGMMRFTWKPGAEPEGIHLPLPLSPTGRPGVMRAAFDRDGRAWLATWYGLLIQEGSGWRTFTTKDGLRLDGIQDIVHTPEGEAWIRYEEPVGATRIRYEGGGIHVVEHLTATSGLPSDLIFGMVPGKNGDVWMGTDRGIFRRIQGRCNQISTADGIPTNDCNEDAMLREPDGTVWVGLSHGLLRFPVGAMPEVIPPPSARLVAVSDAQRLWLLPAEPPAEVFSIQAASFTFRLAAHRFQFEGAWRFQVRMDGLEDAWKYAEGSLVQYPKLREGQYTFRVRAARSGEAWGSEAHFSFRVLPPWYRTWWAYALGGCLLLACSVGAVRWRLRTITRQRDHLEAIVRERTREIDQARAELEIANVSLKAQSLTDPLTGLHNRRYLQEALHVDVNKVLHLHRFAGKSGRRGDQANPDLIFLLVDLDHFKVVNDTLGHQAGDEVLQAMASLLRTAMRDTDAIVRWGGEEFLIVAREATRSEGPTLAERIRTMVMEHPFQLSTGEVLKITCSTGFAPFPLDWSSPHASTWERAVNLADAGLYLAKHSGRNGWVGATDVLQDAEETWTMAQLQKSHAEGHLLLAASFSKLQFEA